MIASLRNKAIGLCTRDSDTSYHQSRNSKNRNSVKNKHLPNLTNAMNEAMPTKQALSQKTPKLGNTKQALRASGGRHTSLLTQGGKREIEIPRKASASHSPVRSTLGSLGKDLQLCFYTKATFRKEVLAFRGISISRFPPWVRREVWRPPEARSACFVFPNLGVFEKVLALWAWPHSWH